MAKKLPAYIHMRLSLSFVILAIALLELSVLASCSRIKLSAKNVNTSPTNDQGFTKAAAELGKSEHLVDFKGVSFNYSSVLASKVEAKEDAAVPLKSETDKPDSVAPTHLSFRFSGSYPSQHASSFFSPRIRVYPIAEYRKVLSLSRRYVELFSAELDSLRQILFKKPTRVENGLPFIPFGMNGEQAFHAHLKYLSFENGEGIFFLTQYNIEPSVINNQGLAYVFQGLTSDGRYYVSATFPVVAPILPKDFDASHFEDYKLPEYFFDPEDLKSNKKNYNDYLLKVKDKLDDLPSSSYEPNLTYFEKVISSLKVER